MGLTPSRQAPVAAGYAGGGLRGAQERRMPASSLGTSVTAPHAARAATTKAQRP
jgi:hypothetical protein